MRYRAHRFDLFHEHLPTLTPRGSGIENPRSGSGCECTTWTIRTDDIFDVVADWLNEALGGGARSNIELAVRPARALEVAGASYATEPMVARSRSLWDSRASVAIPVRDSTEPVEPCAESRDPAAQPNTSAPPNRNDSTNFRQPPVGDSCGYAEGCGTNVLFVPHGVRRFARAGVVPKGGSTARSGSRIPASSTRFCVSLLSVRRGGAGRGSLGSRARLS